MGGDWINVGRREKLRQRPKKMSTAKDTQREVTKEVQMDNKYTTVSRLKRYVLKSHCIGKDETKNGKSVNEGQAFTVPAGT